MFDFFFDIIKMDISSYVVNTAPDVVDLKLEDSVSLLEKMLISFLTGSLTALFKQALKNAIFCQ